MHAAVPLTYVVFMALIISFLIFVRSYVVSDFSVLNVVKNSHSEKPLFYKIVGVWGNHEGSMFLWVLVLTFFSALVAFFGQELPTQFKALVLICQSFMVSAFLLFILFMSNPFLRVDPPALQGDGLNPVLQDIALAIHPPLLYLGYVGFSVCFSFSIAALITKSFGKDWACWVRPWVLFAWFFLTLGITVGSYWAYYELGWGGYWVWDPVENISLMPWLSGTALLHSVIVFEKRNILKGWTLFLAIVTFSLSLMGTFLVRSGIVASVHSFAVDSARGQALLFILFFLQVVLFYFLLSERLFQERVDFLSPYRVRVFIILNNLFLTTATVTVLIGTLYPYFVESLTGKKIFVGAAFFNLTFGSLMIPLLLFVPFGPMMAWKRGDLLAVFERLLFTIMLSCIVCFVAFYATSFRDIGAALGIGLSGFVFLGGLTDLWVKSGHRGISFGVRIKRFFRLPWSVFGATSAHMGLGVTLFGIICASVFGEERILVMHVGDTVTLAGKTICFDNIYNVDGSNYSATKFYFKIYENENLIGDITASKRFYAGHDTLTTEVGIRSYGFSQMYIVPGRIDDRGLSVHVWWKPYVICIWFGALMMAMGGIFAFLGYYFRVHVRQRKALNSNYIEEERLE
ncbi:Cytochrome c heme lyase subunit CcmF [Bartonella ancashensis]|uniref:Cytochrome c heme lyase subunit CcmF n=1 Tax=Bartonella ancashensis TaxID=1318743 RepID=A0A0M4L7S0_9HYPH|nr:Cytochrome c heme lyase subunit CcmF [Bartonella ancashensis]